MKKLPELPKPPLARIMREDVTVICPICYSSMVRKPFLFGKHYCINPECSNSKESKTLEECKDVIEEEIRKECRQEALKILVLGDNKDREDFLKYHKKGQGNICCLVLDFAKKKLVDSGKMKQNKKDCFHYPI